MRHKYSSAAVTQSHSRETVWTTCGRNSTHLSSIRHKLRGDKILMEPAGKWCAAPRATRRAAIFAAHTHSLTSPDEICMRWRRLRTQNAVRPFVRKWSRAQNAGGRCGEWIHSFCSRQIKSPALSPYLFCERCFRITTFAWINSRRQRMNLKFAGRVYN